MTFKNLSSSFAGSATRVMFEIDKEVDSRMSKNTNEAKEQVPEVPKPIGMSPEAFDQEVSKRMKALLE